MLKRHWQQHPPQQSWPRHFGPCLCTFRVRVKMKTVSFCFCNQKKVFQFIVFLRMTWNGLKFNSCVDILCSLSNVNDEEIIKRERERADQEKNQQHTQYLKVITYLQLCYSQVRNGRLHERVFVCFVFLFLAYMPLIDGLFEWNGSKLRFLLISCLTLIMLIVHVFKGKIIGSITHTHTNTCTANDLMTNAAAIKRETHFNRKINESNRPRRLDMAENSAANENNDDGDAYTLLKWEKKR